MDPELHIMFYSQLYFFIDEKQMAEPAETFMINILTAKFNLSNLIQLQTLILFIGSCHYK